MKLLLIPLLLLTGSKILAETEGPTIEYSINSSSSSVTITQEKSDQLDELSKNYLFDKIRVALLKSPYILGVQFTKGLETKEDNKWSKYRTIKRTSKAYINLSLPAKFSILVDVEEEYRKCKTNLPKEAKSSYSRHDAYSYGSSECKDSDLRSEVVINGPLAVYSSFASYINPTELLKEKQSLSWTLSHHYSGDKMKFEGEFDIKSDSFEKGIFKFMQLSNINFSGPLDISLSGQAVSQQVTRKDILVGIARTLKRINEEVVGL